MVLLKTMAICFFVKSTLLEKSADSLFCNLSQYGPTWLLLSTKCSFVTIAVKWSNFFLCRWCKALCERRFALHRQQPEKYEKNVDVPSPGKIFADVNGKGGWGHSNESLAITAVRNTTERSFSKSKLIKTFHRSTMADERLRNLAMMYIESETAIAKTLDMTELTKTFVFLKTWIN